MTISPQHAGPEVSIVCCDTSLPIVKSARYLGVFLDNRLSWDVHVSAIVTKAARKIGALWRARRCLSRSSRKIYVKAIVMPDMIYGACCFSAALRVTQLQRLQAMQNRAIRCIDGSPPCSAMQAFLAANSIYRVTKLLKQKLLIFIWRCLNDSTSLALAQLLKPAACSDRSTRHQHANGLLSQLARSRCGQTRFATAGALLWNSLPRQVRTVSRLQDFKLACLPYVCLK